MEKDNLEKSKQENDQLNDALDQFDQNPLNLTNEQKPPFEEEDPEFELKMQQQYEKFLEEMKNGGFQAGPGSENFNDSLGGLLKGLTESLGGLAGGNEEELKNLFNGNFEDGNLEDIAGKLLDVFMKKDMLYEPLLQSKNSYEQFFKKQEGKINATDLERYRNQYGLVKQIIEVLDNQPQNKDKLMELFEKMQDYGQPPVGIASVSMPGM